MYCYRGEEMTIQYTCVTCHVEMTCLKNEVCIVHFTDNDKTKGIDIVRFGDLWGCKICGAKVVTGLAQQSLFGLDIQNQKDFLKRLEEDNALIEIKRG